MKGHIRPRRCKKKNAWNIIVDFPRDLANPKKRNRKTFKFDGSKGDAEKRLREILHAIDKGTYAPPVKLTTGEFLQSFLDYQEARTTPKTFYDYKSKIQGHLIPVLGHIPLAGLRPSHINSYYAEVLKSGRRDGKEGGLSAQTVKHLHRILHNALNQAVREGQLLHNPAMACDPPKPTFKEMKCWSAEELNIFLEAARQIEYYALYATAANTGCRLGESMGLQVGDIDLELATISVKRTRYELPGGELYIGEPKSRRGKRCIDIPPSLAITLRGHIEVREANCEYLGTKLNSDDWLFVRPDGLPLLSGFVSKKFKQIVRSTSLPEIRYHDLRHTHATILLLAGVHPKIVSERLGHSSVSITLDTYSHVLPGLQKAAAAKFEETLQLASDNSAMTMLSGP